MKQQEFDKEKRFYKISRIIDGCNKYASLFPDCRNYNIQIVEAHEKEGYLIVYCDEKALNDIVLHIDYKAIENPFSSSLDKNKKTILVIHGLGGGIQSKTGVIAKEYFKDKYNVITPEIPIHPTDAIKYITRLMDDINPDLVIGTSLGGFYGLYTWNNNKLLLINPAIRVADNIINCDRIPKNVSTAYSKTRLNGEIKYEIDDQFLLTLKVLQSDFEKRKSDLDLNSIYAIFGEKDELFSNIDHYKNNYNGKNMLIVKDMLHSPTEDQVSSIVMPMVEKILEE